MTEKKVKFTKFNINSNNYSVALHILKLSALDNSPKG